MIQTFDLVSLLCLFYYFQEAGAFTRDKDGTYAVNFDKMKAATISSVQEIITMQGDGDYDAAKKQIEEKGSIKTLLQTDLKIFLLNALCSNYAQFVATLPTFNLPSEFSKIFKTFMKFK